MAAADYRLLTEATGQRIAAALEALSGTGAAAAAARTNLDVYSKGETDTAIAQSTADVIRTGDVINDLTSTATDKPLSANMGKTLNNNIINLVTKYTHVGTTDADGDISILNTTTGRVFVSAIPNRSYGDGTYSIWFGVIVGFTAGGRISVKCVNDNNQKLVSQKVAIDVYFIEGQQLGSL